MIRSAIAVIAAVLTLIFTNLARIKVHVIRGIVTPLTSIILTVVSGCEAGSRAFAIVPFHVPCCLVAPSGTVALLVVPCFVTVSQIIIVLSPLVPLGDIELVASLVVPMISRPWSAFSSRIVSLWPNVVSMIISVNGVTNVVVVTSMQV